MKIAIVTPHPIPFAVGGAENLWWGLQAHIEQQTPHSCDIVSLISPEDTLDGLIASYKAFSQLDLTHYDCVISGKYPGWMVKHPNHVCYMLHRLRGLYDTYSGPGAEAISSSRARALVRWMEDVAGDQGASDQLLPEFFERYKTLRNSGISDDVFMFPGPLARAIVHFLDGIGLSRMRIQRYASNAGTVAKRVGYFPPGAQVTPLHHPPHRHDYRNGAQKYFFTSSRLDRPKRVDLIMEAMRFVKADLPLLIAGSGPDEDRLKDLARSDPRIRFLGFVADDEMPGLYANALAVPYVPRDEDYGLITVEAMRSGKPVVTVLDAGGPTEIVRDQVNGFVTEPNAQALGERLAWFAEHPQQAEEMGKAGRESVAHIAWDRVFRSLMERPQPAPKIILTRKPKLTVAATFPIFPPMGGGQARVFNLYRELADDFDVDLVTLHDEGAKPREIAPGVVEIRIAKSASHIRAEQLIAEAVGRQPVGDIACAFATDLTPEYAQALAYSCATSRAGIACHPYLVEPLQHALGTKPLWYEAQDVELDLKTRMLANFSAGPRLLSEIERVEKRAWRSASHVMGCASEDLARLTELYGPTRARLHLVPNGVALDEIAFTAPSKRRRLQARTGLTDTPVALFMGSWHQPNLEAVEDIIATARRFLNFRFIVLGSVCHPFAGRAVPANLDVLGQVDAQTRNDCLGAAHVALNPMRSGSGTNLKMLDYFAAGVPVISSKVGARGLAIQAGTHFIEHGTGELAEALSQFEAAPQDQLDQMVNAARTQVEERYSWDTIARNFLGDL